MEVKTVFFACLYTFLTQISIIYTFESNTLPLAPKYDHGIDLPTKLPLIIAHRGSSGELPEHTIASYSRAIKQGADIIECDVSLTKDLHLICLHESWLSNTTSNAAVKFPDHVSTKFVEDQNKNITGYFSVDFTLEEIKQIKIKQRFSFRDQRFNNNYTVATLEEYIYLAKQAKRAIGIYPETKDPNWVNSLDIIKTANTTFEELLIKTLAKHGYKKKTDPCFVQSFSTKSLKRMANLTNLPLIKLVKENEEDELTNGTLKELAKFCYGIGPHKNSIVNVKGGYIVNTTDLVFRAQSFGLRIHPYTFRNEDNFYAVDYHGDPYKELSLFLSYGIDGYFTDFPETLKHYFKVTYYECNCSSNSQSYMVVGIVILLVNLLFRFG